RVARCAARYLSITTLDDTVERGTYSRPVRMRARGGGSIFLTSQRLKKPSLAVGTDLSTGFPWRIARSNAWLYISAEMARCSMHCTIDHREGEGCHRTCASVRPTRRLPASESAASNWSRRLVRTEFINQSKIL